MSFIIRKKESYRYTLVCDNVYQQLSEITFSVSVHCIVKSKVEILVNKDLIPEASASLMQ